MSFSSFSTVSNYSNDNNKIISNLPSPINITYTMTGTDFTNSGVLPMTINSTTKTTYLSMNNFNSTTVINNNVTFWFRYELPNQSYARIFSFGDAGTNNFVMCSYKGSLYTTCDIAFRSGNVTSFNTASPAVFSSIIYNFFITFDITLSKVSYFFYNTSGILIYSISGTYSPSTVMSTFTKFRIFSDANFTVTNHYKGTVYKLAYFTKVLTSAEMVGFCAVV